MIPVFPKGSFPSFSDIVFLRDASGNEFYGIWDHTSFSLIYHKEVNGEYGLMLPYNLKHEGRAFSLLEITNEANVPGLWQISAKNLFYGNDG